MSIKRTAVFAAGVCAGLAGPVLADDKPAGDGAPIRTLLITGQNNHNWAYTSRVHKDTLEATGRFLVDITEDPAVTLANADDLANYQLFVLDYNDGKPGKRWGDGPERNFADAVRAGTGVVAIHAANNAFRGWKEYEQMLGLMWQDGTTGHGRFHEFGVKIVDDGHPITDGMTDFVAHPDELYHGLVNPTGAKVHLLMQAQDEKDNGGAGGVEPMAFTLEFGKGRVFATPLGHVWNNEAKTKYSVIDPQFRALLCRGAEWAATGAVTLPAKWGDRRVHNKLSAAEYAKGWKPLFDGSPNSAAENLREYKGERFPAKGWSVRDGAIVHAAGGEGGDLVTLGEYKDFEFSCQWKIAKGGNSGIMYHVMEDHGQPYETGPEMQILDDEVHADKAKANTRAGALYDLVGCSADVVRPAGEWNTARILVRGTWVQLFLNGVKVVDVNTTGEEYKKAYAQSKWTHYPDFNTKAKGHIDLQNHGDEVWFRDLKVREVK